jgi:hypothetical protein
MISIPGNTGKMDYHGLQILAAILFLYNIILFVRKILIFLDERKNSNQNRNIERMLYTQINKNINITPM